MQVGRLLTNPNKLSRVLGMDVTGLMSVPLFICEPFSMLQKMAEIMEYTHLLDAADAAEDPYERCACGRRAARRAKLQQPRTCGQLPPPALSPT